MSNPELWKLKRTASCSYASPCDVSGTITSEIDKSIIGKFSAKVAIFRPFRINPSEIVLRTLEQAVNIIFAISFAHIHTSDPAGTDDTPRPNGFSEVENGRTIELVTRSLERKAYRRCDFNGIFGEAQSFVLGKKRKDGQQKITIVRRRAICFQTVNLRRKLGKSFFDMPDTRWEK